MILFIAGIIVGGLLGSLKKKSCYCIDRWKNR